MMVIAVVQMFLADVVMALVGLLVFPAVVVANLAYQRLASPLMTQAQQLRAELSEVAHESFDGAMVVKTLGREAEETARFAAKAHELRDVNIRAGRIRAAFDPTLAALPNLGVLVVLVGRRRAGAQRRHRRRRRGHRRLPAHHRLLPDPLDRLAAGRVPAQRRRLPAGSARCCDATGEMPYGDHAADPADDRGRPARGRGPRLPLRPRRSRCSTTSTFTVEPGRTVALVGATASGKSTLTSLMTRLVDPDERPDPARRHRPARPRPGRARRASWRWCRRPRSSSTTPCAATSPSAPTSPTRTSGRRCARRRPTASSPRCPHGLDTRLGERGTSLSGGQRQRISLARALVRRPRLLILDDATSAVDPEVEARILAALRSGDARHARLVVVAYRKATIGLADEVVHLEDGRIADRGTHAELLERSPAYARLVNAYETSRARATSSSGEHAMSSDRRTAPSWTPARTSARSRRSAAACATRPS